LASLLYEEESPEAKRHLLQALEEAPRYRDAQELLLKMVKKSSDTAPKPEISQPNEEISTETSNGPTETPSLNFE
jgi:hypothetical protein